MSNPADRLEQAIELAELAEEMLRCKLRRTRPDASEAEIEQAVADWYRTRPGAEDGDAEGRPTKLPRHTR